MFGRSFWRGVLDSLFLIVLFYFLLFILYFPWFFVTVKTLLCGQIKLLKCFIVLCGLSTYRANWYFLFCKKINWTLHKWTDPCFSQS